ncbi:MAG: aminotransferase class I/II-fold pyridoxal phosphate-dependent enzyme [Chloroflexi bacterium]|nr:aminotransferase class I/II-fold pyridoxal phosphate-dependent enzyme [Chloroflexota bacterium]
MPTGEFSLNTEESIPGPSTQSVHAGSQRQKAGHSITTPIIQSATFTFNDSDDLTGFMRSKIWGEEGEDGREDYGRYGNPSVHAVEKRLAALEGGDDAVLFASGMAAITTLLLASLPSGAHIVMTNDCYRRTRQFCTTFLKRLGIETSVVPMGDYEAMEAAIIPKKTRIIISESPTNPYLRLVDFAKIAAIGKQHKVVTLIDSTFGTPINQQPLAYGIDYVLHSATKYLGGHNDLLAGVIIGNTERIGALRQAQGVLGSVLAPQNAYLLERGLKTLALRVHKQNENGLALACYLESHPKIERVWYPGLTSHPDYALAHQQMQGFGGVVSFTVKGDYETTKQFIDGLHLPFIAPSLGGTESLVEQPAIMSYFEKEPEERLELGIFDNLVRYSTGIEDTHDIIADIEQALAHIG